MLDIRFFGVRGSLASPGRRTAAIGGNTSCVEVASAEARVVLDAGTGLRALGDRLIAAEPGDTTILLSHLHWDHIQGLPFFKPLYAPGHGLEIVSGPNGILPLDEALRRQMSPPFFPVPLDATASAPRFGEVQPGRRFAVADIEVTVARLNHPDPVYGYRLERDGVSVVYATDTEHYSCVDPALRTLAAGADVLIYDAQYTPEEYRGEVGPSKVGWGHSTFEAAAELARVAGARQLILFHHDPARDDDGVLAIEDRARDLFPATAAAREGMVITVSCQGGRRESAVSASDAA